MLNEHRNSNNDYLYDDTYPIDDYSLIINTEPSTNYYSNHPKYEPKIIDYSNNINLYPKINSFHCSQEKNNFSHKRCNYPLKLMKTSPHDNNYNINTTSVKEFSFWDKNLSNLSLNKYKRIRDYNDYSTIPNDKNINTYRNDYLINGINSFEDFFLNKNKVKKIKKIQDNFKNNEENESSEVIETKNNNLEYNSNLRNKIKLEREIINYNNLEKKIEEEKEKINKHKKLKQYKKDYYTHNSIINFNSNDLKNKNGNIINELINTIRINKDNSHKKLKRKKGDEDDINSQKKIKRNTTFTYKDKEKEDNINYNFIKYLKKDNQKLIQINTIYKQLIDTFFYFVNQLSKKYSYQTELKDLNYYISNANELSKILIDLEQHLYKIIKENNINREIIKSKINKEKENETDNEQELVTQSKFVNINTENKLIKPLEKPFKTRNTYNSKEYLNKKNKSNFSNNKMINKTLQNTSLNFFNTTEINNNKEKNKMNNILIKIKKNNGKLLKAMNKLKFGFFSPKQLNLNNKVIKRKNKINSSECLNLDRKNKSNDLYSVMNSKYIKKENLKYIN